MILLKIRSIYTCPLEVAHDMIRGKWKAIIIFQLRDGKHSLSYLKQSIKNITEKVLIEQLKELISFGFVDKIEYSGYPKKVEYFLTNKGIEILEIVYRLQKIGNDYLSE